MIKGRLIGRTELFDIPGKKFYLIYCTACDGLFNLEILKHEVECINCHTKIKLDLGEKPTCAG
jgi:hypothetical protein